MIIVKPYARLVSPPSGLDPLEDLDDHFRLGAANFHAEDGLAMLRRVEWCARISHRSEDKQTEDSYEKFLRFVVLQKGDWSVTEHCVISADILVDRGLSHELVRHRIAAYTQESTRFCNYGKHSDDLRVVLPDELASAHEIMCRDFWQEAPYDVHVKCDHMADDHNIAEARKYYEGKEQRHYMSWIHGVLRAEREYMYQVKELKVAPEIARDMLPHCLAVRMIATHNLRMWRHLMLMRTTIETHRKLRPLMGSLLAELKQKVPVLYEDIEFGAKQAANLRLGR